MKTGMLGGFTIVWMTSVLFFAGCAARDRPRSAHRITAEDTAENTENKGDEEYSQDKSDDESSRTEWTTDEHLDVDADADLNEEKSVPSSIVPDRQSILKTIRTANPALRVCYERRLQGDPTLAGLVLVAIVVGKTSKVKDVKIIADNTTLGDQNVLACIQQTLMNLTFDTFKDVGGVIRYPFVFSPSQP